MVYTISSFSFGFVSLHEKDHCKGTTLEKLRAASWLAY